MSWTSVFACIRQRERACAGLRICPTRVHAHARKSGTRPTAAGSKAKQQDIIMKLNSIDKAYIHEQLYNK